MSVFCLVNAVTTNARVINDQQGEFNLGSINNNDNSIDINSKNYNTYSTNNNNELIATKSIHNKVRDAKENVFVDNDIPALDERKEETDSNNDNNNDDDSNNNKIQESKDDSTNDLTLTKNDYNNMNTTDDSEGGNQLGKVFGFFVLFLLLVGFCFLFRRQIVKFAMSLVGKGGRGGGRERGAGGGSFSRQTSVGAGRSNAADGNEMENIRLNSDDDEYEV